MFHLGGLAHTLLFKLPAKFDSLLRGLFLGVAARFIGLGCNLRLFNLTLGVCDRLAFGVLDLLPGRVGLPLRDLHLAPGVVQFLFRLFRKLTSRGFEILFGLLG